MRNLLVTGTDTDVGKTVVAAMLTLGLNAAYFKPVQCGTQGETDVEAVKRMTGLDGERVLVDAVTLSQPFAPQLAAELDGVTIDLDALDPARQTTSLPLIVESTGGLFVPVNRETLFIDLFAEWGLPVVLTARTQLGTLNHTLLSLEVMRTRGIEVLGVVFVGDDNPDNMRTISEMGNVKVLGRLPRLDDINADTLTQAFAENFNAADFGGQS